MLAKLAASGWTLKLASVRIVAKANIALLVLAEAESEGTGSSFHTALMRLQLQKQVFLTHDDFRRIQRMHCSIPNYDLALQI